MNLEIRLNNTASRTICGICGGRIDPQVGPQIVIEGTWSILCDDCARRHAPMLFHVLNCWDGAVWSGPSPESDQRQNYNPNLSTPRSAGPPNDLKCRLKCRLKLVLGIDVQEMKGADIIRAVEQAGKTITAFVTVVEAGIGTENLGLWPIRLDGFKDTRAWIGFTHEPATAWPLTADEEVDLCNEPAGIDEQGIPF